MLTILNILLSINIVLLVGGGLYFSFKLCFPQLRWKKLFSEMFSANSCGINSLMLSLAARVGVGSIAGVALAIYIGGAGTIFWIWIIGIITAINTYCECYLGFKYQKKEKDGYIGGPSYYMERSLGDKKIAIIYAILVILAYIVGFMTIQANTITVAISNYFNIDTGIIGILIAFISLLSIINGLKTVINITNKLVPIMCISYLLLGIIIVFKNIGLLPEVFINILKSAFNIKPFFSGFLPTFTIGIKRGVFSTEAGLGTTAIASSTASTNNRINSSLMQILGIYFTAFIICSITAIIILTSNYDTLIINNINGIELMQYALRYHLGQYGNWVLLIAIIFLAYSTIIAGYYYGESSLRYLLNSKISIFLLKVITVSLLLVGSLMSSSILWNVVDILVECLVIINMYSLLKLRKEIIFDYRKGT